MRKLKALGLTESLEVGYRLSPRGRAFLRRAGAERSDTRLGPGPMPSRRAARADTRHRGDPANPRQEQELA